MEKKKVAIIGAGLAGLVTIKSCLEEGMEVIAFEKNERLGGNWHFQEGGVSVFRHTELTSSKYLTAFSDFPMPENFPHFLKHEQYLDYLLDYARHFDLQRHIKFEATVTRMQRQEGKWLLNVSHGGTVSRCEFDAVAVCTGLNEKRNLPAIPNQENFQGKIVHSSAYKDNIPYREQNVVIVGGGESGGDILNEISQVAKEVTLSLRRGVFVMPKLDKTMTLPGDYFHHRSTYHFPPAIYDRIETLFQNLFNFINRRQKAWQIRQKLIELSGGSYHQQFITKSDVFLTALAQPHVFLKPAIQRFDTDGVVFADGSKVKAEAVIFSSGFKVFFPFLPIESRGWDWRKLYKNIFHPELTNLGFIGFARPNIGAIPPVTELQSRYFAGVASGRLSLPSLAEMESVIKRDARETAKLKPLVCERVTSIVSFVPYMYELAGLIGCRPILKQLLNRPLVLWSVLFGTVAPPHFRLCGPHADPKAFEIIAQEGLHLQKLKTPQEKFLFFAFQIIWGVGGILSYPLFKAVYRLPGCKLLEPQLDF
ncbi:NAD(P)-binding domain-containing protein [Pleurocapsa sp. PCC 7319]|uniref:NAD(P)-binding domain-containing protein n=1 Tax=Pleurocapsa sp. PCC 7319 TaxID=118161 RepID=UPI00034551C2|nr:NAD(P)-binding domain-containing protein [Pleurocapsa sp. PCC 7319]